MKKLEPALPQSITKEDLDKKFGDLPGYNDKVAEKLLGNLLQSKFYMNDVYQVAVRNSGDYVHLSIKRIDREPIHDWRDLQEIKNQLVGRDCEAVELYPADDRLTDSANQYHLWAVADPTYRFPFGFMGERFVIDGTGEMREDGTKQRPFKK